MKIFKKVRYKLLSALMVVGLCILGTHAIAKQGGIPGKPDNSGNGSDSSPPDLGDLFVLYRDADGVPILTDDFCQQPLDADGKILSVDPTTCAVLPEDASLTQEVDFGRTSVVRSPASVLEQQLQDVIVNLSTAGCVTLDPAGRLVTSVNTDGVVSSAAIDSPLQNLAIYRQLMLTGSIGVNLPEPSNILDTAARSLGASSDKTGKISVDMVAYLNQILGLTNESTATYLPKKCITVKEEVQGNVQMVRKCFLDYGSTGGNYTYDREMNFLSLPNPAYIPESSPEAGWFEYLEEVSPTPTFGISQGLIVNAVPELMVPPPASAESNIGGFAQSADDARAVINFMHSWPLPSNYATPLTCNASSGATYDVSISDQSGLQVPVQMVDGSEGREFTVTVDNAGPNPATGNVTVSAVAGNGVAIVGSPWVFTFTDLAAGATQSFVQDFSIDLGEQTTISWTAIVSAPYDVLSSNNTVTATTNVKVTGGGHQ